MKLAPAWWLQFPKRQTILVLCLLLLLHALQHGPCEFLCSPDLLICSLQWSLSADRVDRTWVSSMLFLRLPSFLVHYDGPWSRFFLCFVSMLVHWHPSLHLGDEERWVFMFVPVLAHWYPSLHPGGTEFFTYLRFACFLFVPRDISVMPLFWDWNFWPLVLPHSLNKKMAGTLYKLEYTHLFITCTPTAFLPSLFFSLWACSHPWPLCPGYIGFGPGGLNRLRKTSLDVCSSLCVCSSLLGACLFYFLHIVTLSATLRFGCIFFWSVVAFQTV